MTLVQGGANILWVFNYVLYTFICLFLFKFLNSLILFWISYTIKFYDN